MRLRSKAWTIALALLLLLGLAGGAFYWHWSSPTARTRRLLDELENKEPRFFAKILIKIGLKRTPARGQEDVVANVKDLVAIGSPAVPQLLVAIQSGDTGVSIPAIVALGQIRDRRAVDPLRDFLVEPNAWDYDEVALFRDTAIWALSEIGDPRAVPDILRLSENPILPLSAPSLWIAGISEEAEHIESLVGYGVPKATFFVVRMGDGVIPTLAECLKDPNAHVRAGSAECLGVLGALARADRKPLETLMRGASGPLIESLGDKDENVVCMAARALATLRGDARSVAGLLSAMRDSNDGFGSARKSLAQTIGEFGGLESIPELQALADDPNEPAREEAKAAISEIRARLAACVHRR